MSSSVFLVFVSEIVITFLDWRQISYYNNLKFLLYGKFLLKEISGNKGWDWDRLRSLMRSNDKVDKSGEESMILF